MPLEYRNGSVRPQLFLAICFSGSQTVVISPTRYYAKRTWSSERKYVEKSLIDSFIEGRSKGELHLPLWVTPALCPAREEWTAWVHEGQGGQRAPRRQILPAVLLPLLLRWSRASGFQQVMVHGALYRTHCHWCLWATLFMICLETKCSYYFRQ